MLRGKVTALSKERGWREQVSSIVDADTLKALGEQSSADTVMVLIGLWTEVGLLLLGANLLLQLPLGWAVVSGVVVVLLLGTRMNAFGVIVHEGSHGLLTKSRAVNDQVTNWGAAFWTINSVEEYRPTHRLHHRYLGGEMDPDRTFYLVPAQRGALAKLMLQDLVGITAFRRATTRLSGTSAESAAPASLFTKPRLLIGKAITQLAMLGQFVAFQGFARGVGFYAVFWLVPIVCIYPMILRLKTITEHYDAGLRDPTNVKWTARTSCAGHLQNHLIGARMQYHFEHHIIPTIPYQGLRKLHRQLEDSGLFADHREFLSGGYGQFLTRAVTRKLDAERG